MAKRKDLIDRRIASDKRIIASAMKRFGSHGFTYASIRDIAKDAGITSGLITQRYKTKEHLFLQVYCKAMDGSFSEVDRTASPRECLYSIIGDIEKLCDESPDAFAFIRMLHNASDYPREILRPYQEQLKKVNSHMILEAAQREGILPEGNLDVLLSSFGAMVFQYTEICKRYSIAYPEPDKYLEILRFNDQVSITSRRWYRVLAAAIGNAFDVIVYINIPGNTGNTMECSENFVMHADFEDARQGIELAIQSNYPEEEWGALTEYLNLETMSERMKGRKSISLKSRTSDEGVAVHSILPVTWDEQGNLTEILACMYRIPLEL